MQGSQDIVDIVLHNYVIVLFFKEQSTVSHKAPLAYDVIRIELSVVQTRQAF
jgi:hypothetical protein